MGKDNCTDAAGAEFAAKVAEAIPADVRVISGCRDHQYSADGGLCEEYLSGACTQALVQTLTEDGNMSWMDTLKHMKIKLHDAEQNQVPMLSTSRMLDLKEPFSICKPDGRHKSLLIGINYVGKQNELSGCHNDVRCMKEFIMGHGFTDTPDTMRVIMDDGEHAMPNATTIIDAFKWLVAGAKSGDSLFLHYSGHGCWVKDENGDEEDGRDEAICALDGNIIDDDLFTMLVEPLPAGVQMFALMDCCHSGTILDLPYVLLKKGVLGDSSSTGECAKTEQELEEEYQQMKEQEAMEWMAANPHWHGKQVASSVLELGLDIMEYGFTKLRNRKAAKAAKRAARAAQAAEVAASS